MKDCTIEELNEKVCRITEEKEKMKHDNHKSIEDLESCKKVAEDEFLSQKEVAKETIQKLEEEMSLQQQQELPFIETSKERLRSLEVELKKKIVCSRCFGGGEIVKQKIIEEARNTEGYDFLPLCKLCFDANIPVARSGKKKRNFFLAKIQSNKHDTRENYVDTGGKRVTKKKKLEENKEKEVVSPICHERMELSTRKGGNKDPHIIKRFSSTGQLESGTCNYCNSIPSNHYCRAKVKGSGIKISGSDEEICGKLSCMVCREEWGDAENYANVCKYHANN